MLTNAPAASLIAVFRAAAGAAVLLAEQAHPVVARRESGGDLRGPVA